MEQCLRFCPAGLAGMLWRAAIKLFAGDGTPAEPARSRTEVNARAEQLLDRYGNSLLRYAYSYLHNMEDAEEVLQDTLMQFLKTAPVFLSREHANLSKNRLNYNKLRQTDELNEELTAEGREDLSFVWDAVRQLPENCREAVHLFYYEGLSTKQIASVLQRKESTVRSDLHRGREQLKTILKEAYDFEV